MLYRFAAALLLPAALLLAACPDNPAPGTGSDDDDGGGNRAPTVSIDSPADGAAIPRGTLADLRGSADDPEDGPLRGDALAWSSDRDGFLGAGEQLSVQLSSGGHVITLTAEDSEGLEAEASISVFQQGDNQPPAAFIDAPADGAGFTEGNSIDFAGRGDDPEDGALSGASLTWTSSVDGLIGNGAAVSLLAPSLGPHTIVLTVTDSGGLTGLASIDVEVFPVGSNLPPTASITAPADGSVHTLGQTINFAGSASDPEDGALSGAAVQWTSNRDGSLGSGTALALSSLSQGVHDITLTATDSGGEQGADTVTISVNPAGNTAPVATVSTPANGAVFNYGDPIDFTGSATDAEDGALSGAALGWSSDQDGALGSGSPLQVVSLSIGRHRVTLTATDSGGATGTDFVDVTILAPNDPPTVTITAPAPGTVVDAGTQLRFEGTANDPEDGPITGAGLRWSSNLDGPLGSGSPFDFASLSVGSHTVTLSATDSGGRSGSDQVDVTVSQAPANLPPVARLSAPLQAFVGTPVDLDGSASSDPDGVITNYRFSFDDGSPDQSGVADSAQHTWTQLGTYTVTLTVTDDDAEVDTDTADIEIIEYVRAPELTEAVDDDLGSRCDIAVDSALRPHVVYRNNTHAQLWYAVHDGAGWRHELVDGPGFGTGSTVSGELAVAVDSAGRPHVAYRYQDSPYAIRYALLDGGLWTREQVNATLPARFNSVTAIALDPANGEGPVIAWTRDSWDDPAVGVRTAPGAWTEEAFGQAGSHFDFTGGLAIDSGGTAYLTFGEYWVYTTTWSPGAGFSTEELLANNSDNVWSPLVLDDAENPVILHEGGIEHMVGGLWTHSEVETFDLTRYDAAWGPLADLRIALQHGGDLEILHSPLNGYWERAYQGPMDNAHIGIAVGWDDEPRACFFRDGNLLVY